MQAQELINAARLHMLSMAKQSSSPTLHYHYHHLKSAFSCLGIIANLYANVLNYYPDFSKHPNRDRFILSKGHACCALYAVLAELGFFPKAVLKTYYQDGSQLSGLVSHKSAPGIDFSTGSLGHGLSVAAGICYNAKLKGHGHKSIVLLGDGECEEGSVWEAIYFASKHQLNNLIAIIDYNDSRMEALPEKFTAFGWRAYECDGSDSVDMTRTFKKAYHSNDKPSCVIVKNIPSTSDTNIQEKT